MDLRRWIITDLQSSLLRLQRGVLDIIPPERRRETADGGGIPPLYVLWHMSRHHDLAMNRVVGDRDEVLDTWADRVGIDGQTWRGLTEGADLALVDVLDPDAVGAYATAVLESSIEWLAIAPLDNLDEVPAAADALAGIGTPERDFDWLYGMWEGKPRAWFLSWEGVGHIDTHTGELVSLRNRMGLSPF